MKRRKVEATGNQNTCAGINRVNMDLKKVFSLGEMIDWVEVIVVTLMFQHPELIKVIPLK